MRPHLDEGHFYGRTLRKRDVGGLTLADVEYDANSHVPSHSHKRPYFCLIRHGSYVEKYSRAARVCGPTMLVFHPPGETHSEAFGEESVASFNVELGPGWLAFVHESGSAFDQPAEFQADGAARLALQLFHEFSSNEDPDSELSIKSIVLEILACYVRRSGVAVNVPEPHWLRRAKEAMMFDDVPSLRQLATIAGVHPVHFAAVFRRFNGCSVGQYARSLRLERARKLLSNPTIPLAEIALQTGFADQSHFTRVYKRFTGRTPAQERTFLMFKTNRGPLFTI